MEPSTFLNSVAHFVGIDVSKGWLDCYLRPLGQYIRVNNDSQGFEQLAVWLDTHGCDRSTTILCMENTGIYDDCLLEVVQARNTLGIAVLREISVESGLSSISRWPGYLNYQGGYVI